MSTRTDHILPEDSAVPTANERFKRRARAWTWGGISLSVLLHFLILAFGPVFTTDDADSIAEGSRMEALEVLALYVEPPEPDPVRPLPPPVPSEPPEPPAPPPPPRAPEAPELQAIVWISAEDLIEEARVERPRFEAPAADPEAAKLARFRPFMPNMVKPELRNRREVRRALERRWSRAMQAAGIQGRVVLLLWIDEDGAVQKCEVELSSGSDALDDAAVAATGVMAFRPALNMGEPVAVIASMPVSFDIE